jgi:hypothetical protein
MPCREHPADEAPHQKMIFAHFPSLHEGAVRVTSTCELNSPMEANTWLANHLETKLTLRQ